MVEQRSRDIVDPRALRAMAHPLRLRILEAVALSGPITATGIAEIVGESPANCSWHLRQLARYGFVAEAGGGTGRQRPWRVVTDHRWAVGEAETELARAGDAALQVLLELEYQALREWVQSRRRESPQWRDAGFQTQAMGWCTAEELAEIRDEISRIFAPYLTRLTDPDSRPAGSRPVRFMAWGVPAVGHPHPAAAATSDPANAADPIDVADSDRASVADPASAFMPDRAR